MVGMSESSKAASALAKRRWEDVSDAKRSEHGKKMAKARLAPPEGKQYLDIRGLVKAFGHSRGFFLSAIHDGRLASTKPSREPRGGKHWVLATDALKLVRAHEKAAAERRAGK